MIILRYLRFFILLIISCANLIQGTHNWIRLKFLFYSIILIIFFVCTNSRCMHGWYGQVECKYNHVCTKYWWLPPSLKANCFHRMDHVLKKRGGMTLQAASTRRRIEPDRRRYALFIMITDMLIDELISMLWL